MPPPGDPPLDPPAARAVSLPPAFLAVTALTWIAWSVQAGGVSGDPRGTLSTLLTGIAVFAFLPAVMGLAMSAVGGAACLLLGPFAVLAQVATGRPSGFRAVAVGLLAPGVAVVPGYVRALQRCRSPLAWGFVAGSCLAALGIALYLATRPAG